MLLLLFAVVGVVIGLVDVIVGIVASGFIDVVVVVGINVIGVAVVDVVVIDGIVWNC